MIVGTAGHIDHGKTSLVKALTGVDTDRLKEEKARGITIELGFAYWPRPSGVIGFVDVPGHERLVHTMLAGASGIDFVLLAVAADDGVMPQTREHLAIVDLLGIDRGLVVVTKSDLADQDRLAEVEAQIRATLAATGLGDAEILPVSAQTGAGMPALADRLDRAAAAVGARDTARRFRLAVDRVFPLAGAGTVATGTVVSGSVAVGDRILVSPSGLEARVRSIHAQNRPEAHGMAGQRCALALVGPKIDTTSVARGDVLIDPTLHDPVARIDAWITLLPGEPRPMGQWMPVRLHHGSVEVPARVVVLGDGPIAPGASGFVQLVLQRPIVAAAGDRFVLRDTAAERTVGGGTFLDLHAPERRRRTPERQAELEALRLADPAESLGTWLAGERGWADLTVFARERALPEAAAGDLAASLDLVVLTAGGVAAGMRRDRYEAFEAALGDMLDAFHAERPDQPGLGIERVRLALKPRLPTSLFAEVVQRMRAAGRVAVERSWLRRPWHEVRFSPEEERTWATVRPMLGGTMRFRPPRVRDVARERGLEEASLRRLFRMASKRGDLDEVAHDHFFLAPTVAEMAGIARELADADPGGAFTVTGFRDRLDNGRKVAIQILEFFDRQGFTMRRGDIRRINPHKATMFFPAVPTDPVGPAGDGGESSPVGRPGFKPGEGRETALGGFDSYLLRHHSDGALR